VAESSPAQSFFTVFGAAVAGFGAIFLAVGLIIRMSTRGRFGGGAEQVEGRIVGFDSAATRTYGPGTMSGGIIYRPTVTFTTRDGREVTATSPIGTNPKPGNVGDVVPVRYDPRNPQRVRVDTVRAGGGCLQAAFMAIGGVLLALGLAILISAR
jgi:Protein of unknown function (DUF3592)